MVRYETTQNSRGITQAGCAGAATPHLLAPNWVQFKSAKANGARYTWLDGLSARRKASRSWVRWSFRTLGASSRGCPLRPPETSAPVETQGKSPATLSERGIRTGREITGESASEPELAEEEAVEVAPHGC